ncbi:nitrite reductase small subunit NirD [Acidihalobacter ferrooxydans]|uniref:Nitrite reductase (NAD(P)H) small subunit n=1 Tax=Acidihalobacter ferrooxydans TaxID=1765967 RepID=A0A1P8UGD0_9GAMM|nr:nitrite reductase small subunit NirD [Acidihalobacter ferrooxydans]APZ42885.1 nitrite reductase (NAD(P)H) small subunit [Acidihalobacter ferrooxydans]
MSWLEIGSLDDIPRLGARVVRTPQGDIAVFRTLDDQVFALRDACPHKGGPLSQGIVHGHRVTCPLHNWKIELASGAAVAPDEGCAGHYPARVENGRVSLNLAPETANA